MGSNYRPEYHVTDRGTPRSINILLNPDQWVMLDRLAKQADKARSCLARDLLMKALEQSK